MDQLIQILHVEDDPADAELVQAKIEAAGLACRITCVQTRADYHQALEENRYDIILTDFRLPMFDGLSALKLARERCPEVPFIFVSGTMGEDAAIDALTEGATDYVLKQKLTRLVPAIKRALHEAQNQRQRKRAEAALQASEARMTSIIKSAMDAIISVNDQRRIVLFNAAAEQMFGCSAAQVSGQLLDSFIPERLRQAYKEQLRDLALAGPAWHGRGELGVEAGLRSNGEEFPIEGSISKVETPEGKLYTIILRDITMRKQLEEQLAQSQKMESIGRLASGMAHDFNNLLTIIRGYVDLMLIEAAADHPWGEGLGQIRRAGERATELIRQLLAFSRQQILAPTVLDLNLLVTNLNKMLERLIGEDITLSTTLQPDLWSITADSGKIEQVIMNLAVNARDAMPTGGRLTIETANVNLGAGYAESHLEAPAGPCVLLSVSDNGQGMDPSTQAHIFEPFFTTKEQGKGTGLGLATVYGIIKQSEGYISVYSEPGQGTTFKIYLPATELAAPALVEPQVRPVTRQPTETILLVEDDEAVRDLVRQMLQAQGYTILAACSGDEALSLARQHQGGIDMLLTDVVMPYMSGRKLAQQLTVLNPRMKVLFISGYTSDAAVRIGLLTDEVNLISKPFSPNVLSAKVREVLDT
jgi:two-component system cell cycle sensor histidine kinase/response regulator CckA